MVGLFRGVMAYFSLCQLVSDIFDSGAVVRRLRLRKGRVVHRRLDQVVALGLRTVNCLRKSVEIAVASARRLHDGILLVA